MLTEEVCGPAAPLVVVRDADEAIARANDTRFGLSNNLWTRELDSGGVFVNGMTASDPRLPFVTRRLKAWRAAGLSSPPR